MGSICTKRQKVIVYDKEEPEDWEDIKIRDSTRSKNVPPQYSKFDLYGCSSAIGVKSKEGKAGLESLAEQIFKDLRISQRQPFELEDSINARFPHQNIIVDRVQKVSEKERLEQLTRRDSVEPDSRQPVLHFSKYHLPQSASIDCDDTTAYQRVVITGTDTEFISQDLLDISKRLVYALQKREKYMRSSRQSFPHETAKMLPCGIQIEDLFDLPGGSDPNKDVIGHSVSMKKGIVQVSGLELPETDLDEFIDDRNMLYALMSDGKMKSFCFRRMSFLKSKFELHKYLNGAAESAAIKDPLRKCRRDLYNVRKVDTHIHAAACMSQKHLLGFIYDKYMKDGHRKVLTKNGEDKTLIEVFEMLNLDPNYLNVDSLDMHAGYRAFRRFDIFNNLYNPANAAELREIFLKTNNKINGEYFGEMIKQVADGLAEQKYIYTEPRISIYGKERKELADLAQWFKDSKLVGCTHMRWVIQVPRIYEVFKKFGAIENFEEMMANLFIPFFEATLCPNDNRDIAIFLSHVTGFDSVDDESKPEMHFFKKTTPTPDGWNRPDNPSYTYYLYYMYTNIAKLNHLRQARGMNTFKLRPHCGEAGHHDHLIAAFLMAENISHGLNIKKVPSIHYLYYLAQIGVCMSPLSNNQLFVDYQKNPLFEYLQQGLSVSLSTDDPLMFHYTNETLMEEYAVASQVWKLSTADICEIAKNSVLHSGFPHSSKQKWLGDNYKLEGVEGNDITKSNVPNIRVLYRKETLDQELFYIMNCVHNANLM